MIEIDLNDLAKIQKDQTERVRKRDIAKGRLQEIQKQLKELGVENEKEALKLASELEEERDVELLECNKLMKKYWESFSSKLGE